MSVQTFSSNEARRRPPPPLDLSSSPVRAMPTNEDETLEQLPKEITAPLEKYKSADIAVSEDTGAAKVVANGDLSKEQEMVGIETRAAKVKRVTKPVPSILDFMTESEIKRLTKANTKKNLGEQPRKSFRFSRVCKRLDNLQFDETTYLLMPPMDPTPIVHPHSRSTHNHQKSQNQSSLKHHSQHPSPPSLTPNTSPTTTPDSTAASPNLNSGSYTHGGQNRAVLKNDHHHEPSKSKFPCTPRRIPVKSLTDLSSPVSPETNLHAVVPCSKLDCDYEATTPRSLPHFGFHSSPGFSAEGDCNEECQQCTEPNSDDCINGYVYRPCRPSFSKNHTRSVRISSRVKVVDYFKQKSTCLDANRSRSQRHHSTNGDVMPSSVSSSACSSLHSSGNENQQSTNSSLRRLLLRKSASMFTPDASPISSSPTLDSSSPTASAQPSSVKSAKQARSSALSLFSPHALKASVFGSKRKESTTTPSSTSPIASTATKPSL